MAPILVEVVRLDVGNGFARSLCLGTALWKQMHIPEVSNILLRDTMGPQYHSYKVRGRRGRNSFQGCGFFLLDPGATKVEPISTGADTEAF